MMLTKRDSKANRQQNASVRIVDGHSPGRNRISWSIDDLSLWSQYVRAHPIDVTPRRQSDCFNATLQVSYRSVKFPYSYASY